MNHGLILKKAHKFTKKNQRARLKPYIYINKKLRKKAENSYEKDLFNLMNNAVFGETMGNGRKHRDIKIVATKRRRNYLISEPDYNTTKIFVENLSAIEWK